MSHVSRGRRFDSVDRIIALLIAATAFTACSKDSTSPPPVAASIAVVAGASQTATVGTTLAAPVVVTVTDQSGNPLAGVAVTFAPTAASGSVSASQVTTDATGSAQVVWTLGTVAGTQSVTMTVGTLSSIAVSAAATPDVPANITIVGGNDQSATAGSSLSAALSVMVADQYGNGVPNVAVQWSDDAGGSLATVTSVTDATGMAQDGYTLGPTAGAADVVATLMINGVAMSVSFLELAN